MSLYFPESPSFIKTPAPVEGIKGKDASLHCEVYGTPPFQINWYKDKRPLTDGRKHKMVSEDSFTALHIIKLEHGDAGLYECNVSNNVGAESCRTTLSLKGWYRVLRPLVTTKSECDYLSSRVSFRHYSEQPAFVKKLVDQLVRVGQPLTLTATVKGSEPFTVSWVQGKDHILRDGDNRQITFENNVVTLVVPKVDATTAGKYTCHLSNDSGTVESICQITVLGL